MADKLLGIRPPSRSWQVGAAYRDRILVLSSIPDDTYEASGLYHSYVTNDMFASTTGSGSDGDADGLGIGSSTGSGISYTVSAADGWGYTSADELAKQYMAEPVIRIGANRLDDGDDVEDECVGDTTYCGDEDGDSAYSNCNSDKNDKMWYDARKSRKSNDKDSTEKGHNYDFIDSFVNKYNIHSFDDEPAPPDLDRPNHTSYYTTSSFKNQHPLTPLIIPSNTTSSTTSPPIDIVKNKAYSQLSMLTYLSKIASNPTTSLAPTSSSSFSTSSATDITHLADSVLFQYAGSNRRANKLRYMPLYQDVDWSMSDVERHDDVSRAVGDWLDMLPVMGCI